MKYIHLEKLVSFNILTFVQDIDEVITTHTMPKLSS